MDVSDDEGLLEAEGLLASMENGFRNASYALSKFLTESEDLKRKQSSYQEKLREKRTYLNESFINISKNYQQQWNVLTEDDLPWEKLKEVKRKQREFEFNDGIPPRFWVNYPTFFYANNFAIGIDQIVLSVKKLKDYQSVIINNVLFENQISELNQLTESKDIGAPDPYNLIESENPVSVFFYDCFIGNNLTYTNHEGVHKTMEISLSFF